MDKIVLNILKKLENNGYSAYIVGGYVRNYLINIKSNDVDICTNALPKDVIRIFKLDNKDSYGSVNIKTKRLNIDITTYRKESDYNSHYPNNTIYIDDIKEDLKRRDFTMNAILMDSRSKIIDYYGGIEDIKKGIIKCIGDTSKKLTEDPLRILRAIRLSIIYDFKLSEEIKDFINNNSSLISKISYYRRKEELDYILSSNNRIKGLNVIKEYNLTKVLGIKYDDIKDCNDILGMYAQMDMDSNYSFTKSEKNIINSVKNIISKGVIDNEILYKYGLYISSIAGQILGIDKILINRQYKNLPIKSKKDIKININTLVKLNNNCYNGINEIYSNLESIILNGTIKNTNKDIIKYLEKK